MSDNLPKPCDAKPGHMPEAFQRAEYQDAEGELYPGWITSVGDKSPDGKYVNVQAVRAIGDDVEVGGWLFEIASGRILYIPKGPPWP